jgi:hypothetical protein
MSGEDQKHSQATDTTKRKNLTKEESDRIMDEIYRQQMAPVRRRALQGMIEFVCGWLTLPFLLILVFVVGTLIPLPSRAYENAGPLGLLLSVVLIVRGAWIVLSDPRVSWEVVCELWRDGGKEFLGESNDALDQSDEGNGKRNN